MGWDFVTFGDRHAKLHDLQLWALRHFLANAARELADAEPSSTLLKEAYEYFLAWDWPAPGVVTGTELDAFVRSSNDRKQALVRICDAAIARLREFDAVIPLSYLEAHVNAGFAGEYTLEQPSEYFIKGVERIRALLVGD